MRRDLKGALDQKKKGRAARAAAPIAEKFRALDRLKDATQAMKRAKAPSKSQ